MVYKKENMTTSVRSNLKGGEGDISFINFADCTDFKNCRVLTLQSISKHFYMELRKSETKN